MNPSTDELIKELENKIWNLIFKTAVKIYPYSLVNFVQSREYKKMKARFEYFKRKEIAKIKEVLK